MSERGQPRIVCAANRLPGGRLLIGPRHWDQLMSSQAGAIAFRYTEGQIATAEQGFIDQFGTFYDRQEAWKVAEANAQIIHRCGGDTTDGGTLFSENLY